MAALVTRSWAPSLRICSSTSSSSCKVRHHRGRASSPGTRRLEELSVTAPRGYALMRTTVSFANDFVALGAMNCALEIIDWSLDLDSREAPDVDGMIALLAAM